MDPLLLLLLLLLFPSFFFPSFFWSLEADIAFNLYITTFVAYDASIARNLDPLLYHIFSIGAHFSKPRLRVQKYLAAVPESEEMKARLERHLALDMEVYEWAKETYKPSLVLSSSWSEYMLYNPLFMFELAVLGVILYTCCKAAFVTSKKATTAACGESTAGSLPRVLYIQEDISKI